MLAMTLVPVDAPGAEAQRITVDFSQAVGEVRALHGINKGPLAPNGLIDVTEAQKKLRIPSHGCTIAITRIQPWWISCGVSESRC